MLEIKLVVDKALTAGHMADRVEDGVEAGVAAVTEEAGNHASVEIGRIYSRAIPQWGNGNPRWERSGDLQKGLTIDTPDRISGQVLIEGDAAKYAARREGLGVDWQPANPAPKANAKASKKGKKPSGLVRKNPFARDAARKMKPKVTPIFEAAFRAELDK